jgi:pimeloyl-ACP methyl ester carboxylesterase
VADAELKHSGSIAYREAIPEGEAKGDPVLCIHGFPESSYMWQRLLPALAAAGYRALAPDLPGFGDSEPDPPGTWERHLEALEAFRLRLGLESVALVVHDWGGLIGLRWACDHPGAASAIVASDTGFFPDGKWHGLAKGLRTPEQGEELIAQFTREGFAAMLASLSSGFDEAATTEYWKTFERPEGRRGVLELYRSGDFEKLEPYRGKLAALGVPFLALWGENDQFAPPAGAYRFRKEISHAEVVVIDGAGHFAFADAPNAAADAVIAFLNRANAGPD